MTGVEGRGRVAVLVGELQVLPGPLSDKRHAVMIESNQNNDHCCLHHAAGLTTLLGLHGDLRKGFAKRCLRSTKCTNESEVVNVAMCHDMARC